MTRTEGGVSCTLFQCLGGHHSRTNAAAQHSVQRAPDGWESARFQAVSLAHGWFRQSGVVLSHPPAGNADRWVAAII